MVTCSRCGQEGHNRRSATCPGVAVAATLPPPAPEQLPHNTQSQQQPNQGIVYPFVFCQETFVEPNADLYDRVFVHNIHFTREFLSDYTDEQQATDDNKVFLVSITNPLSGKSIVVNVGGPHREYETEAIYAPTWILQALNIVEAGHILWQRLTTPPPRATKISLRPIDALINEIDGRAEIEEHLKNFNVLQEGTEIQIPLRQLGNTLVTVYVEKTEPAQVVLLRDEVELDLLESVLDGSEEVESPDLITEPLWDPSQPSGRPPTPIPGTPTMLIPSLFPEVHGNILQDLSNTTQHPGREARRQMMAAAAERRRLAAQELDTSNGTSNE